MLAAVLGAALLASVAAPDPCAARGGLESGVCRELQQSAPSGLDLLQRGQHGVGKAEHAREGRLAEMGAMEPIDMPEAADGKLTSKVADYVIGSDPAWAHAKKQLSEKALARMRELIVGRSALDTNQTERTGGAEHDRNTAVSPKGAKEWSNAWHKAKDEALERGAKGISAALRLPAVYHAIQEEFNPRPEQMAVESTRQARREALEAQPVYAKNLALARDAGMALARHAGTGTSALELQWAKKVMLFANLKAEKDVDWQRAMDELGHKALESLAANALLATATDALHQAPDGIQPLARKVELLADQKAGADRAFQLAKEEAKEKAMDKVSADLALESFEWIEEQVRRMGIQALQMVPKRGPEQREPAPGDS